MAASKEIDVLKNGIKDVLDKTLFWDHLNTDNVIEHIEKLIADYREDNGSDRYGSSLLQLIDHSQSGWLAIVY